LAGLAGASWAPKAKYVSAQTRNDVMHSPVTISRENIPVISAPIEANALYKKKGITHAIMNDKTIWKGNLAFSAKFKVSLLTRGVVFPASISA
jgi:hypothetical protein